jgi:DNA-binding transcriptional LysR family regulator
MPAREILEKTQRREAPVQKSTALGWDDLRYALALSKAGSLARAAKLLGVDHTTVGRRVEAAEAALGLRLFARTAAGYALSPEGERLLGSLRAVEEAVLRVERAASTTAAALTGPVRVTAPETFGVSYLAPRLARFGLSHPGLTVELTASGEVLDLGRREADVAVRLFRSRPQSLVVKRVADVGYGLYASPEYLAAHPVQGPSDLRHHRLLTPPTDERSTEGQWVRELTGGASPCFVCGLTLGLLGAALAHAGVAVLPRYLGDAEAGLQRIPMPQEPSDGVWLTVHADVKEAPRVRVLLDFLTAQLRADRPLLHGAGPSYAAPAPAPKPLLTRSGQLGDVSGV